MPAPTTDTSSSAGFAWAGVLPGLLAAAWVLAGVLLLLVHAFHWWLAVPVALVFLAAAVRAVPPSRWYAPPGPRWALPATVAVAVLAAAWAGTHASQNLVVRRDPGPYGLIAAWIGQHGTMAIPRQQGVFGHLADIAFATPAFYGGSHGTLQPQFMSGLPVTLAPAWWLGGLHGVLLGNAVIGGLALLAFGGFVARAVGPRWAPFATAVLAVAYPETHAMRSAYSEPLAQLLWFTGLCLLWDTERRSSRGVLLGGAVLGLTTAVRIDAPADLLPMAAVVVVYALAGRGRAAWALTGGLVAGVAVGAVDGFGLHLAYVQDTSSQLRLVGAATVGVAVLAVIAVAVGRRLQPPSLVLRQRLGVALAVAAPLVIVLALFVRPYVQHPHSPASDRTADEVGRLQALQHLAVDPHRTYAEWSARWLGWWIGLPALLIAAVAAGLLLRRWLAGRDLPLLPALTTGLATTALVLWRPSITPDHPWADRRFVPVVLPVVVLLATWLLARAAAWRRRSWAAAAAAVGALAVAVPTAAATWPLAWTSTENGQLAALRRLCEAVPADAAVLFVDPDLGYRWAPGVRDDCRVPTGYVIAGRSVDPAAVAAAAGGHGRRLVLLGASAQQLAGRDPVHVVDLTYRVDQRSLTRRPDGTDTEHTDVWLATVPTAG